MGVEGKEERKINWRGMRGRGNRNGNGMEREGWWLRES